MSAWTWHQKTRKSWKNSKLQFYSMWISTHAKYTSVGWSSLSILYARREVMSHQCDYSLHNIYCFNNYVYHFTTVRSNNKLLHASNGRRLHFFWSSRKMDRQRGLCLHQRRSKLSLLLEFKCQSLNNCVMKCIIHNLIILKVYLCRKNRHLYLT